MECKNDSISVTEAAKYLFRASKKLTLKQQEGREMEIKSEYSQPAFGFL
jgi:hypothetical protein